MQFFHPFQVKKFDNNQLIFLNHKKVFNLLKLPRKNQRYIETEKNKTKYLELVKVSQEASKK
jgi:hypothetical protein